jgi:hypothetical protein
MTFLTTKRNYKTINKMTGKKKSRFWGSFWRETGRNTGKWTSNKIFGVAGWATPRRHIFDGENSTSSKSKPTRSTKGSSSSFTESKHDWSDTRVERIIDMANEISFNTNNVDEICSKLDDLLTGARTANKYIHSDNLCNKVFVSKIKSGIMRLRRNHERELAEFYTQELKSVTRSANWSKAAPWIFVVVFILFLLIMNYVVGNFD